MIKPECHNAVVREDIKQKHTTEICNLFFRYYLKLKKGVVEMSTKESKHKIWWLLIILILCITQFVTAEEKLKGNIPSHLTNIRLENIRPITPEGESWGQSSWSPDSKKIYLAHPTNIR
ncbi:MAG: hypothetical protein WC955_09950, partial [Elusimicrobiota bacterium]